MQIPRRIEEVRAEPVPPEVLATAFGQRRKWNPRRVRTDDGSGLRTASTRSSRARLTSNRSTTASTIQSAVERSRVLSNPPVTMRLATSASKNGSGFSAFARFSPFAPPSVVEVEQRHRQAGVGDVRGNLRAHRPGAEDRDGSDSTRDSHASQISP